jgi:hypothetical protein
MTRRADAYPAGPLVHAVAGDAGDPAGLAAAFDGVDRAFLMSAEVPGTAPRPQARGAGGTAAPTAARHGTATRRGAGRDVPRRLVRGTRRRGAAPDARRRRGHVGPADRCRGPRATGGHFSRLGAPPSRPLHRLTARQARRPGPLFPLVMLCRHGAQRHDHGHQRDEADQGQKRPHHPFAVPSLERARPSSGTRSARFRDVIAVGRRRGAVEEPLFCELSRGCRSPGAEGSGPEVAEEGGRLR